MESQSTDHDTTPATSERLMSGHQPASNNSIIATSSTCMELERSDHNAETNIIIQQDSSNTEALQSNVTPGDTKTCNTDNIENSSDSQNTTTVKDTRATSVSEQGDPSTETEGVSDKISVNKDVPHADTSSGDTEMCSSHDLMETIGSQATTAESDRLVVVMKQENGLESDFPQLTATSCNLVATDGRNSHVEVKKICETDQSDNIESANIDCIHITIKQEPSVAFHDLVCVPDGSNDERLDEGATEPSCYTLDYRGDGRKDSSSSVDSSDSDEVDSDDAREMHKAKTEKQKGAAEVLKTKGEITLENLPPLEELHIMLAEDVVMAEVGSVRSVIGPLVVVEAREGLPALNMDTILFLEGRKVMGQVFETFGPVASPFYSVRYNCESDIERLGIEPHQTVFYAPSESQYTHYIFLEQLTSLKGSDASWEDNNEPPDKFIDFSDDEEERRFKAKKRNKSKEGSADGDQEGKRKPQTKRKQDDHQRSRQGQGSGSMQPTTRQNGSQDGGMPPWRNMTPNPFSHMGTTPDRGSSGQHPPQGLQQWPPPPSQTGDHSQFSSPPPRPPMFPGIDESSLSWRPYGPPRGWNHGNINHGNMNQGYMNQGNMNGPSQWDQRNNPSPFPQPPNFATGPPGSDWQPFSQHRAQFGQRPNFMPGAQNHWHP